MNHIGMGHGFGGYGRGYMGTLAGSGMSSGVRPPTREEHGERLPPYGFGPLGMDAFEMAYAGAFGGYSLDRPGSGGVYGHVAPGAGIPPGRGMIGCRDTDLPGRGFSSWGVGHSGMFHASEVPDYPGFARTPAENVDNYVRKLAP